MNNLFFNLKLKQKLSLIFLFFSSGTGKTTLVREMVARMKPTASKIYFLNASPEELGQHKHLLGNKLSTVSFEKLKNTIRRSVVVFEDLITVSKNDEKHLRACLNFDAHHKIQKVICISHAVYKTSLFSLLSFFHYIIFTSATQNAPIIRICLKIYFKLEESLVQNWLNQFLQLGKNRENVFFYFDCATVKFYYTTNIFNSKNCRVISPEEKNFTLSANESLNGGVEIEQQEAKKKFLENKFEKIIEGHICKPQAVAIFSILVNCLDLNLIRDHDLTISFQYRHASTGGKPKQISLIDYILSLLDGSNKKPSEALLVLHNYIQNYCTIPSLFILNSHFEIFPALKYPPSPPPSEKGVII